MYPEYELLGSLRAGDVPVKAVSSDPSGEVSFALVVGARMSRRRDELFTLWVPWSLAVGGIILSGCYRTRDMSRGAYIYLDSSEW